MILVTAGKKPANRWSHQNEIILMRHYMLIDDRVLAVYFGITKQAVRDKAMRLKKESKEFNEVCNQRNGVYQDIKSDSRSEYMLMRHRNKSSVIELINDSKLINGNRPK